MPLLLLAAALGVPRGSALQPAIKAWPLELAGLLPGSDFAARHKHSKFMGVCGSSFSLSNGSPEARVPVTVEPVFPRCFLLRNVLSPAECEDMIRVTERLGYEDIKTGVLNNNAWLTWVLDELSVEKPLFERCREHLPAAVSGPDAGTLSPRRLSGLNPRARFYRYLPNDFETFKPHRDDPNPGAGFVGARAFHWDLDGERASLLTFLLYLNDDFAGGETTFNLGGDSDVAVRPVQGSVLVFPQVEAGSSTLAAHFSRLPVSHACARAALRQTARFDDSDAERARAFAASPLHEGSRVRRRREGASRPKYVLRSDVLYGLLDDASGWRFGERRG